MKSSAGYCPPFPLGDRSKTSGGATGPPAAAGGWRSAAVEPLSLRMNFSWIAAGNAVGALSQWGVAVVLAHVGNFDMIGLVVLAYAVCAPVNALGQLGLRGAVITDAESEYQFGDYLALRLITATLALLVVVGIALSGGYEPSTALVIAVIGLSEMLKSISDIFHGLLQQRERMDRIGIAMMIRGPLMLAALALGVYLTGSLLWGIAGFPLVLAAVLLVYDIPNAMRLLKAPGATGVSPGATGVSPVPGATGVSPVPDQGAGVSSWQSLRPRWQAAVLVRLAVLTLPLGVVLMMVALTTSIPRYMVSHYAGNHALGVFMSIAYLGVLGLRVVSAMGQSAGPRLAKYYAAGNMVAYGRLLLKLSAVVGVLGVAAMLGMALIGGPVLSRLYAADFTPHVGLGVWLMGAAGAMYLTVPLGIAVEAMRRFKTHMVIRSLGIGALLLLTPPLIAGYGLQGAAAAMAVASALTAAGCACVVCWAMHGRRGDPSVARPTPADAPR